MARSLVTFDCKALIAAAALALPWLNPFATGPSPAIVPWLFSICCTAAGIVLLARASRGQLVRIAAWAWLGAALISVGIGLLQYFGAASLLSPWVNVTGAGEAYANLRQRNQFATLTSIGLAALVWVSMRKPASAKVFTASLVAAALLAVGNAASSSRTGLVQLIVLAALFALWGGLRRTQVQLLMIVAGLGYVGATVALPLLAGLDPSSTGILAVFTTRARPAPVV